MAIVSSDVNCTSVGDEITDRAGLIEPFYYLINSI